MADVMRLRVTDGAPVRTQVRDAPAIRVVTGASSGYVLPVATAETLGGVKVGDALEIRDGVLSVLRANAAEADNTLPITSAAVHTELGNIAALLSTI
nr:MAG TPA: hypothetical protein [Caudoviricetes sp.]